MIAPHRFHRVIAALLTTALVLASATPSLGSTIYQFTNSPSQQNGNGAVWDLSGTIEVSRTGLIGTAEILAYSWTIADQGASQSYSFSGTGADAVIGGSNPLTALTATESTLTLQNGNLLSLPSTSAPIPGVSDGILYWQNNVNDGSAYQMYYSQTFFWFAGSPASLYVDSGNWVIGNSSHTVPEIDPATGGSALSLVAGVLAMIEQRRRRRGVATALTA
jgi:hypothetical protein